MRIDKVEIDGFGKLNNREFVFADGVNLIYGENESGKSTLCEFLLSAFYGLPTETKKDIIDMPTRQKYRPWNTDAFGGRVYFTDDSGKNYVIEKSFKTTPRSDKSVLRDAATWEEIDSGENLGERIFGLSRKAFLKTLYVRSLGADSLKSDDGEIMSRLSNLETGGDEDISYSKIINALEKEIFHLKTKTGRGGKITELEDKINALKQELSLSQMTYSALLSEEKRAQELKAISEQKEKEAKLKDAKYNLALMHEKYENSKKIKETKQAIEERIKSAKEKLNETNDKLQNLDTEDDVKVSPDEISRARALETKKLLAEEKLQSINSQKSSSVNVSAFAWLLLSVAGIVAIILKWFVLGGALLVLGVGLFFAFFNKGKNKNHEILNSAQKELDGINDELSAIFKRYGVSVSDELSALFMNSKGKEEKRAELTRLIKDYETEIEALIKSIPQESTEEFSDEVKNYSGESSDEIYQNIKALREESIALNEEAAQISVRLARETAEIRKEADITADLQMVTEEAESLKKRHASLTKAAEWLARAHSEIKNNFAPKLNQKASEFLAYLTAEKYQDVRATDAFGINLKNSTGEIVEAEYMSRGTYDLMYLALRFAAMSVLTEGKIPPVILDDAFSQLDDTRLKAALGLIKESPEFSQVLLFTCHENYKTISDDFNVVEL